MRQYEISKDEYKNIWLPIQNKIFTGEHVSLPQMVFKPTYRILPILGGDIPFEEDEFNFLKKFVQSIGDRYIIFIQAITDGYGVFSSNGQEIPFEEALNKEYILMYKIPLHISWKYVLKNNKEPGFFHTENFFIYSESARWGKYVANADALDIYGVKKEYEPFFGAFLQELIDDEEKAATRSYLPPLYKKYDEFLR